MTGAPDEMWSSGAPGRRVRAVFVLLVLPLMVTLRLRGRHTTGVNQSGHPIAADGPELRGGQLMRALSLDQDDPAVRSGKGGAERGWRAPSDRGGQIQINFGLRSVTLSSRRRSQRPGGSWITVCFQRWSSPAILGHGPIRATSSTNRVGTAAMALFLSPAR